MAGSLTKTCVGFNTRSWSSLESLQHVQSRVDICVFHTKLNIGQEASPKKETTSCAVQGSHFNRNYCNNSPTVRHQRCCFESPRNIKHDIPIRCEQHCSMCEQNGCQTKEFESEATSSPPANHTEICEVNMFHKPQYFCECLACHSSHGTEESHPGTSSKQGYHHILDDDIFHFEDECVAHSPISYPRYLPIYPMSRPIPVPERRHACGSTGSTDDEDDDFDDQDYKPLNHEDIGLCIQALANKIMGDGSEVFGERPRPRRCSNWDLPCW